MGWLRDLVMRSEPPLGSLGELARRALAHAAWPAQVQIQERSLAALLSKLDRSQELDWLRDRPEALDCLAQVLGRPSSELRLLLGDAPVRRDRRMLRLHDLRFSRDVDLVREELPPGFPDDLKHPVRWGAPLVWVAPSGAGRTWLGAYLEARGLAHVGEEGNGHSLELLPDYGPVFVDLGPKTLVDSRLLERLHSQTRPVCLAVATEAQLAKAEFAVSPRILHSPEPASYLDALSEWAEERLNGDGYYDRERSSAWVRQNVVRARAAATFGEILGFLGLTDELSPRQLAQADLPQVLKLLVKRRLLDARETTPLSDEQLVNLLIEVAARLYLERAEDLAVARPASAWLELFSTSTKQEPERGVRSTRIDLVPHSLFRALLSSGLFCRTWQPLDVEGEQLYQLAPHCLTSLLRGLAYDEILNSAPEVWGRGLLLGRGAPGQAALGQAALGQAALRDRLFDRAKAGDYRPLLALMDISAGPMPSVDYVSALEGSIESLGAACLFGHSPPSELCHDLLREYAPFLLRIGDSLEPRLQRAEHLLPGLLALSLEAPGLPPELDPIRCSDDTLLVKTTQFLLGLAGGARKESAGQVLALVGRSWQARGVLPLALGVSETAVLNCLLKEAPAPECALQAVRLFALEALQSAREACSGSRSDLYLALWQGIAKLVATSEGAEEFSRNFTHLSSASAEFWRRAPSAVLASPALAGLLRFDLLLPHQHDALVIHLALPMPASAVRAAPLELTLARLEQAGPALGDEALAVLFERGARRTARCLLLRYLRQGEAESLAALLRHHHLLTCLPDLPATQELMLLPAPVLDGLRQALIHACQSTSEPEHLAQLFQRSAELERALRPLLRAQKTPLSSSDRT